MPLIQVRDIDDAVHDELKVRAAARGQSLNSYLKALLADAVRRPPLVDVLDRVEARGERSPVCSVDLLRPDRDAR